jgi:DNA-binding NarL/FixJ family response regulator
VSTLEAAALRRDTVLVVDDTPETLELVDLVTPDLVLMDAVMPGIDGFETCRRLKRDKLLAHLPIIFMTGLSETEHVVEGLACGGVDYVTKPLVLDELLARIRVHLGNARLAQDSQAALDASGRFLFAVSHAGRVLWCTPKARQLLEGTGGARIGDAGLPQNVVAQLLRVRRAENSAGAQCRVDIGGRQLACSFVSPLGPDELLFRVAETGVPTNEVDQARLQRSFGLTSREAEVLLWISLGKANRDIGEILSISPRTVNKHLEQVFTKLGVENRAAAAAAAVRAVGR